jgi:hypothetical protein
MTLPTLEDYLARVAEFVENDYGKLVRHRFNDSLGSSDLAMLISPTADELVELQRAVAIMTQTEKAQAATLSDERIQSLAEDARVDAANLAIFFNGYALTCKRISCPSVKDTDINHK